MGKSTTAKNLQKIIKMNFAAVVNVEVENKDVREILTISSEKFNTDLDFYVKSGIFSDSLDFTFEITGKEFIRIQIGWLSSYCNSCITVKLKLCEGIKMEQVIKQLRETLFDMLPV